MIEKGTELIEFGLRDLGHPDGSCTDCEYHLALQLQESVGLLKEMMDCFDGSENEVIGQTEKFLKPYDVRVTVTVEKVNLTMLRRQRRTLLHLMGGQKGYSRENLEGLLSLCDVMLDIGEGYGDKL